MSEKVFKAYVGIDYSGAGSADKGLSGLQVSKAYPNSEAMMVRPPAGTGRNWNRREIAHWCLAELKNEPPTLIGIDHAFSFPASYMKRYRISSWDHFLDDFQIHWPTDRDDTSVESIRKGNQRSGHHTEFRLTENWTPSTQSVFKLDGAGTVGKSTHAGIPWLRFLRRHPELKGKIHFWPFDGFDVPAGKSVAAEVFPSIFRKRFPRRFKTGDEHDAMCVAQWMKTMDSRGLLIKYFKPPLTDEENAIARLEGWILGVY